MADQYERSAEFIDLMMEPYWTAARAPLADALRGVPGPVVDVGAGGGHGTRVIARAVPEAHIVAVEPSPALRAVLLARAYESADLRERVTVLPEGLLRAALPDRLGALVAMNVIGHFSAAERAEIWRLLAARLVPGGRAVLNLQPPSEAAPVPEFKGADVRVGRRRYEGWGRAEPVGPDRLSWRMTYRTYQDADLVDELDIGYDWWVLDEETLRAELKEHDLGLGQTGPAELGMYVIEPRRSA